jgi:hypothetical protein
MLNIDKYLQILTRVLFYAANLNKFLAFLTDMDTEEKVWRWECKYKSRLPAEDSGHWLVLNYSYLY